ncbi:MAG: TlpA family protein disulfide reductase [Verrucomicrobia bacterium]|nr:TlpA family protein disulfide reductase [Verrucomicrobiota bacterium]
MKTKLLVALSVISLLISGQWTFAAEQSAPASELKALITKVQAKMKELMPPTPPGTPRKPVTITEADIATELKEFDTLLAKYQGEKSDDVAQILYMKASLYAQVLRNETKADELMAQLKSDFPDSRQVANLKKQEEAKKIQDSLAVGSKFPDFNEKDLDGKPLSLANYKGKVVLIDFWAVWCGPCVKELPHVLKAYEKHHDNGFEIIGISLDQDKAKLDAFIKENKMPWQQFFDGQGWKNKLSTHYGVNSIPATYLIDGEGTIIGKNLRGDALETAVAKALGKS